MLVLNNRQCRAEYIGQMLLCYIKLLTSQEQVLQPYRNLTGNMFVGYREILRLTGRFICRHFFSPYTAPYTDFKTPYTDLKTPYLIKKSVFGHRKNDDASVYG